MAEEVDLVAALRAAVEEYRRPPEPLGPLLVPDWMVSLTVAIEGSVEAGHARLDREARTVGFDGWTRLTSR